MMIYFYDLVRNTITLYILQHKNAKECIYSAMNPTHSWSIYKTINEEYHTDTSLSYTAELMSS